MSLLKINYLYLDLVMVIVFIFYSSESFILIENANAQMNMDSFSARGIINIPITHTPLVNEKLSNNTQLVSDMLTNSNKVMELDSNENLPSFRGQWVMEVNKGEVEFFRVLFALIHNDKIINAFALFNLTDTKYVQLNDKGTEIITGTVDLTSKGLKNETIYDIPATITITGLTTLRILLDENIIQPFFTDPIIGSTRFLADASGNVIVQPAPPQRNPSSPSSPPSQGSSFLGSNFVF